jgi:hypothetical protein
MAWLANLDARADRWPTPGRWTYIGMKWALVALGAFALLGVLADRIGIWSLH